MNTQNVHLSSAEIATSWTSYLNNTMSICILTYMLKYIQDEEIKPVIQFSLDLSTKTVGFWRSLFEKEQYAVPNGFKENDVNLNAPWLFTDVFCLNYVNYMAKAGMLTYSDFLAMSTRKDICEHFTNCLTETAKLYNQSTEIALKKGILARHPYIEVPKETDYIESKAYLSGLNPFNAKRSLNAVEIAHLYHNFTTNSIGMKLTIAFAQTSQSKEIQEFMIRGRDISKKHIQIFMKTLLDNDIETPNLPDLSVSNSTIQTFSDKLLMFHISLLSSAGTGNYATAAAASLRTDLILNYVRLSVEIAEYAKTGADIMIKHGWLEQPPGTKNRIQLAQKKEAE